jgi:hypothetical protein
VSQTENKISVVVTSIAGPNEVLSGLAHGCKERGYHFIVVGDQASPPDFELDGCDFYSLKRQTQNDFKLPKLCPTKHYARKNIGYLIAIANGASVIVETDDDNIPYESFWQPHQPRQSAKTMSKAGWVNVYRYFTDANIWPRWMPLEHIGDKLAPFESLDTEDINCPIQQGLADENPDVDAIYRLTLPLPQVFRKDRLLVLTKGCWCPFNSQNTTWHPEAFALLYLPSYCSFRMTDIWRSFVAQRIAWENNWGVLFHEPTMWQKRNEHDLIRDFEDEVPGYLHNGRICKELEALKVASGPEKIGSNLRLSYEKLVDMSLVDAKELDLVDAWIEDLGKIQKSGK